MGTELECCCQERGAINDAKRDNACDDFKLKLGESQIERNLSIYTNKSIVSTVDVDTINSNPEIKPFEPEPIVIDESEKLLLEDKEYMSLMEKYKKLIGEAKLLEDQENIIEGAKKPLDDSIILNNVTYDKENDQKYKVTIKEHILNKVRYHEIFQQFQIKNVSPENYTFSHILMPYKDMVRFDDKSESHILLCHYEEDGVFYYVHRFVSKKNIFMHGKEIILASAFKKLDNGKYIDVMKSLDDPDFIEGANNLERVIIRTGSIQYEPYQHETDTTNSYYNVHFYQYMDPGVKVGVKVIKIFLSGHFKRYQSRMFPVMSEQNDPAAANNWREKLKQARLLKWIH